MTAAPQLDRAHLRPGMRLAVAVSGGADSVGLLRALAEAAPGIGLVLSVAHVHHGIRGMAADEDAQFAENLTGRLGLPFHLHRVNTPVAARQAKKSLEETARELRYAWFRELLAQGRVHGVATAHTLDDQAETVLHRLLRGAWTEGLGAIHPVIECTGGVILRPFLSTRRTEIATWLRKLGQPWREDASNADTGFTRNRIRHELLPQLAAYNPRIAEHLAHLATLARDEESWWELELQRMLPALLLPGRPVRGGGRAVSTHPDEGSVGMELERLRALAPAVRRRVLRAAAKQLGCGLNFEQTERLMTMCQPDSPRREQLTAELWAERSARELRLAIGAHGVNARRQNPEPEQYELPIPGSVEGLGIRLRAESTGTTHEEALPPARLRTPRPGDRVKLRYSRGPRPLKEIFERMRVSGEARKTWPVVEWQGKIVWMQGVDLEPDNEAAFVIETVTDL